MSIKNKGYQAVALKLLEANMINENGIYIINKLCLFYAPLLKNLLVGVNVEISAVKW